MSILEQGIAWARKAVLARDVHETAHGTWLKERGHWNFLTWAFFISQVLGAEQFIGKAAAATATDGDLQSADSNGPDDAASRSNAGQLADLSQADAGEKVSAAVTQGQVADANGAFEGIDGLSKYEDPNVLAAIVRAHQDEAGAGGGATQVASQDPGAGCTPPGDSPQLPGDGCQGPLPGLDPGPILNPGPILDPLLPGIGDGLGDVIDGLVDEAVLPITDTVADLVQSLGGTIDALTGTIDGLLDGVVAPLTGTVDAVVDGAIDPLLDSVGDLVGSLGNSLEQVTEPLTGAVRNLTEGLGESLEQVTEPLTGAVQNLTGALGDGLEQVTAPLTGTVSNLVDGLAGDSSDGGLPLIGGLVGGLMGQDEGAGDSALGDAVGSAGQIVFNPLPLGGGLGLDNLFSGGRYTDYNLALRSSDSTGSAGTADSGGSSTLLEQLLIGGDEYHQADAHQDGMAAPLSLPSALDDIALRGLGDGISL